MNLPLWHAYNEAVAKHIALSNGRMEALAVVPPYDTPENLKELNQTIEDLHLKGIQRFVHYDEDYLDEPAYCGFLKYVAKKQIPVYVHHS